VSHFGRRPHDFATKLARTLLVGGVAGLFAGMTLLPAAAQGVETTLLKAISVNLEKNSDTLIYYTIWREEFEQELAIRRKLSEVTKRPIISNIDIFEATFKDDDNEIVLSAAPTPGNDCQSYSKVGFAESLLSCPMKIAFVRGADIRVIYSDLAFPLSIGVTADGELNNKDEQNKTVVMFDPLKKTISTQLIENGNVGRDSTTISLKY
jgi:hypothetical protein